MTPLKRSEWMLLYLTTSFGGRSATKKSAKTPQKCFLHRATNVTFWNSCGLCYKNSNHGFTWSITKFIRGQRFCEVVFFTVLLHLFLLMIIKDQSVRTFRFRVWRHRLLYLNQIFFFANLGCGVKASAWRHEAEWYWAIVLSQSRMSADVNSSRNVACPGVSDTWDRNLVVDLSHTAIQFSFSTCRSEAIATLLWADWRVLFHLSCRWSSNSSPLQHSHVAWHLRSCATSWKTVRLESLADTGMVSDSGSISAVPNLQCIRAPARAPP